MFRLHLDVFWIRFFIQKCFKIRCVFRHCFGTVFWCFSDPFRPSFWSSRLHDAAFFTFSRFPKSHQTCLDFSLFRAPFLLQKCIQNVIISSIDFSTIFLDFLRSFWEAFGFQKVSPKASKNGLEKRFGKSQKKTTNFEESRRTGRL